MGSNRIPWRRMNFGEFFGVCKIEQRAKLTQPVLWQDETLARDTPGSLFSYPIALQANCIKTLWRIDHHILFITLRSEHKIATTLATPRPVSGQRSVLPGRTVTAKDLPSRLRRSRSLDGLSFVSPRRGQRNQRQKEGKLCPSLLRERQAVTQNDKHRPQGRCSFLRRGRK